MLESSGFNQWANKYDGDIMEGDKKGYPFAGYFQTLSLIQQFILEYDSGRRILDIGVGTGLLTEVLYQNGYEITGVDFSAKMLEKAREKMPGARLLLADMESDLIDKIAGERFDFILSTYTLHHIPDNEKVRLLIDLSGNLTRKGAILIGDIAFENAVQRAKVKNESPGWDDSEFYFAADEIQKALAGYPFRSTYTQTSLCSGVLILQRLQSE